MSLSVCMLIRRDRVVVVLAKTSRPSWAVTSGLALVLARSGGAAVAGAGQLLHAGRVI